ncbi:MAG: hypothetical protein R3D78_00990 [Paracoccaceae bacterium]
MDIEEELHRGFERRETEEAERLKVGGRELQIEWCRSEIASRTKIYKYQFKDKQLGDVIVDGFTWHLLEPMVRRDAENIEAAISLSSRNKKFYRALCDAVAFLRKYKLEVPRQVEEFVLDVATGALTVREKTGRPSATSHQWAVCNCIDFLNYRLGVTISEAIEILAEATEREFATIEEYWKKKHKAGGWHGRRMMASEMKEGGGDN